MIFRFRYKTQGGHTHAVLFAGNTVGGLGKCGDLTFRNEEWDTFCRAIAPVFGDVVIEFLPEES